MAQAEKAQGIEYAIYTFEGAKGPAKWEKKETRSEMSEALAIAEKMFGSGQYSKIEVKQKYFDKKKNRNIDVTLKVFEGGKKFEINALVIFIFALVCGASAFGITWFLTR